MVRKVKKENNFIFISLVTEPFQMCFTPALGYGIFVQSPLFVLC